jgi:hypothetical protein
MNKIHILATLLTVTAFDAHAIMDHSRHRGSSGSSNATCLHPRLDKMQPAHLATVSPGGAFSFLIYNIDDPKQVTVEVKKQPVDVVFELKDTFYVVKGKIPDSLRNTAARIDVKINAKATSCRAADGWLVKISEH